MIDIKKILDEKMGMRDFFNQADENKVISAMEEYAAQFKEEKKLPTDREIWETAYRSFTRSASSTTTHTWEEDNPLGDGFIRGAKWMRDLIKQKGEQ